MKSKVKQLESEWGKPISDILTEVIEATETQSEAAKLLGVNQSTISVWLAKLGLRVVRRIENTYTLTDKAKALAESRQSV